MLTPGIASQVGLDAPVAFTFRAGGVAVERLIDPNGFLNYNKLCRLYSLTRTCVKPLYVRLSLRRRRTSGEICPVFCRAAAVVNRQLARSKSRRFIRCWGNRKPGREKHVSSRTGRTRQGSSQPPKAVGDTWNPLSESPNHERRSWQHNPPSVVKP